jgi:hypothetical protein
MHAELIEVKSAVIETYDGEPQRVEGGAYLTPEAYLRANAELERLREKEHGPSTSTTLPLVIGAALLGLAAGYWFGRGSDD